MKPTAIITGASRGIGKAIAEKFATNYNLALISRNYKEINKTAKEIKNKYNINCLGFKCDVGNKDQVIETFLEISKRLKHIKVLINNAGINSRQTLSINKPLNKQEWLNDFEKKSHTTAIMFALDQAKNGQTVSWHNKKRLAHGKVRVMLSKFNKKGEF